MGRAPNILLITTDEERFAIPRPQGFSLPGRERIAERGVTFERFYAASTQCSSARSVMYTGRHVPVAGIYDNDNMPLGRYFSPLAPNRPRDVDALYADNDVVLYDRETDLTEVRNLARDGARRRAARPRRRVLGEARGAHHRRDRHRHRHLGARPAEPRRAPGLAR
jgi:hypothetical protein